MNVYKKSPLCAICNQPMKLINTLKTTPNRSYRIRTFFCSLCNYSEQVYANGSVEQENIEKAIKKASKL